MSSQPKAFTHLSTLLRRLPSIGRRSAQAIVLHLLEAPQSEVEELANALINLKKKVIHCTICGNIAEVDPCGICTDPERDPSKICVVEQIIDLQAIERTGHYHGLYQVLGGVISPLDGIGPEHLRINSLISRLKKISAEPNPQKSYEIILALNPSVEGETTAIYLKKLLTEYLKDLSQQHTTKPNLRISRLAYGIPSGGLLQYTDELTLSKALEGRADLL